MSENPSHSLPPFAELRINEFEMYDHLPYQKDITLCTPEMIREVSGNVLKYYTIQSDTLPVTIDTNDLAGHLVEAGKEAQLRYHSHIIARPEDIIDAEETEPSEPSSFSEGITPLEEEPAPEATAAKKPNSGKKTAAKKQAAKAEPVNAFADVSEDEDDFSFLKNSKK